MSHLYDTSQARIMMTSHSWNTLRVTETFCAGNSPVTGEFPAQKPVTRTLIFFVCAWISVWVNNREADDLDAIALIMTSL